MKLKIDLSNIKPSNVKLHIELSNLKLSNVKLKIGLSKVTALIVSINRLISLENKSKHNLECGDSLEKENKKKLLPSYRRQM